MSHNCIIKTKFYKKISRIFCQMLFSFADVLVIGVNFFEKILQIVCKTAFSCSVVKRKEAIYFFKKFHDFFAKGLPKRLKIWYTISIRTLQAIPFTKGGSRYATVSPRKSRTTAPKKAGTHQATQAASDPYAGDRWYDPAVADPHLFCHWKLRP